MYYTVVLFAFVGIPLMSHFVGNAIEIHESPILSSLFLSNYDLIEILDSPMKDPNGVLSLTWSVSVEEQFYLFWPLLLMAIPVRKTILGITAVIGTAVCFIVISDNDSNVIYHHTIANMLFLGTGGVLAYIYSFKQRKLEAFVHKYFRAGISCMMLLLLVLIFCKRHFFQLDHGLLLYWLVELVFLIGLFVYAISNKGRESKLGKNRVLIPLSAYTYGLYMYHRVAILFIDFAIEKYNIEPQGASLWYTVAFSVTIIVAALGISYISYRYMESPLLRLKSKYGYSKHES